MIREDRVENYVRTILRTLDDVADDEYFSLDVAKQALLHEAISLGHSIFTFREMLDELVSRFVAETIDELDQD